MPNMLIDDQLSELKEKVPDIDIAIQGYNQKKELVYWNKISEDIYGLKQSDILGKKQEDVFVSHNEEMKKLKKAKNIAKLGYWQLKIKENILTWSDETYRIFGIDKDQFPIASLESFFGAIHPDDVDMVSKAYSDHLKNQKQYSIMHRLLLKDNSVKYVEERCDTIFDKDGTPLISNGTIQDITETKKLEKQMQNYVHLVDQNIITSSTDLFGNITSVSQAFCDISGYTKEELIGKNHGIIKHPDVSNDIYENLWNCCIDNKIWKGEIKNRKKNGGFYWVDASIYPIFDENNKKIGYTGINQNITDKKIIEEISITDGLTNIFNRRHFNDIFPKVINSSKRHNELVSFLILDIDHFKQYNDAYGHHKGDEALVDIAKVIKDTLKRADDYCFRLGGEEFGVIFKIDDEQQAVEFANTIKENIESLQIVHKVNSAGKFITASIGLVCKRANEIKDDDQIYKQADDLLYRAKDAGRNKVVYNIE